MMDISDSVIVSARREADEGQLLPVETDKSPYSVLPQARLVSRAALEHLAKEADESARRVLLERMVLAADASAREVLAVRHAAKAKEAEEAEEEEEAEAATSAKWAEEAEEAAYHYRQLPTVGFKIVGGKDPILPLIRSGHKSIEVPSRGPMTRAMPRALASRLLPRHAYAAKV